MPPQGVNRRPSDIPTVLWRAIVSAGGRVNVPPLILAAVWRGESGSSFPNPFVNSEGYGGLFGTKLWNGSTIAQANYAADIFHNALVQTRGNILEANGIYATGRPTPGLYGHAGLPSGIVAGYGSSAQTVPESALPPRPGNPNNPGGAADKGKQGADAASALWSEYESELSPPQSPAKPNFALWGIPGTGWVPQWLDPAGPDPLGVPLGNWNPLHWIEGAGNAVSSADDFFHLIAWMFSPRNILRVVEFVAGAGLIVVGLSFARVPGGSGTIGGTAIKATPWGKGAKALKAATGSGARVRARAGGAGSLSAGRTRTKTKTVYMMDERDERKERVRRLAARAKQSETIPF